MLHQALNMTLQWGMLSQRATWRSARQLSPQRAPWWREDPVSSNGAESLAALNAAAPVTLTTDAAEVQDIASELVAAADAVAAEAVHRRLDELGASAKLSSVDNGNQLIQPQDGQMLPRIGSLTSPDGQVLGRTERSTASSSDSVPSSLMLPDQSSSAGGTGAKPLSADSQVALLLDSTHDNSADDSTASLQQREAPSASGQDAYCAAISPAVQNLAADTLAASSRACIEPTRDFQSQHQMEVEPLQRRAQDCEISSTVQRASSNSHQGNYQLDDAPFMRACAGDRLESEGIRASSDIREEAAAELDVHLPMQFSGIQSRPDRRHWERESITVRSIVSEWLASGHEVITVRR